MNCIVRKNLKHNYSPANFADQIIPLDNNKYSKTIRLVTFSNGNVMYRFLTDILSLDAFAIADLYQQHWVVEFFFKWIKQHLKIKKFGVKKCGIDPNLHSVTGIYLYCLLEKISGSDFSLLKVYRIIKTNLFEWLCIFNVLNPKPDSLDICKKPN